LTRALYTALRRSSFYPFPGLDFPSMLSNFSFASHSLFYIAPRSLNSPRTSNLLSNTSGTSEDYPLILSTFRPFQKHRYNIAYPGIGYSI